MQRSPAQLLAGARIGRDRNRRRALPEGRRLRQHRQHRRRL
jgi:hypothetical protein